MVKSSGTFKHGERIPPYEPYALDTDTKSQPTEIEIEFIASNQVRYKYQVIYNDKKFLVESLLFYPKGQPAKLFHREDNQEISFGEYLKGQKKNIAEDLLPNQLFLSKAASSNLEHLSAPYLFFGRNLYSAVAHDNEYDYSLIRMFSELVYEFADTSFKQNIRRLLQAADTGIIDYSVKKQDENNFKLPENIPDSVKKEFINRFQFEITTKHKMFSMGKECGTTNFPLADESLGTRRLLAIGGLVLMALETGDVLIIDELDKSLHPLLTRLLINLFHSEETNPKKAQLVFVTHDSSLMDNEIFRRDQIVFVEKNYEGDSNLYRLSEFSGVRKSTPFDKWYLSGRFGAIPVLEPLDLAIDTGDHKNDH